MDLKTYLKKKAKIVDRALDKYMPHADLSPKLIHKAMRYSVFSGGKRIRPILTMEACSACGGRVADAIAPACAIELIHTYSLVHDDLPSIDNADYRRKRLTLHKRFDEAIAILAGDALLSMAFNLMTKGKDLSTQHGVIMDVSKAIGTLGMIGGQVMDIVVKKKNPSTLKYIHLHKTGALIAASVRVGAIIAGASKTKIKALSSFGRYLGLSFQIIDDILDREDYFKLFGESGSRIQAERLVKKAKDALRPFGKRADRLKDIADFVLARKK